MMYFDIVGAVKDIEVIATGRAIREIKRLGKRYGKARWRKLKGLADIRLGDGKIRQAELHWYEAHGVGKREYKIKRILD